MSVIGNVQQQNFHVLFDVHDSKFLFAPTNWQAISWIWEGSPC